MDKFKKCTKCSEIKSIEEFSWKNKPKNKRQSQCKSCQKISHKASYEKNKEHYIKKSSASNKKRREDMHNYLRDYTKDGCVDCGEKDYVCLDFDHILERGEKSFEISYGLQAYSLSKIKEELKKCDVVCSNCHRKRTANRGNWYKTKTL